MSLAIAAVVAFVFLVGAANVKEDRTLFPYDDAYISFAYAQNLADGHGLRLTPEATAVEAYSNPLLVVALAGVGAVGVSIPLAAIWIGLLCALALGYATYRLARVMAPRAPPTAAVVGGVLLVLLPATLVHAVSGLETVPAGLALTVAVAMLTRDVHAGHLTRASALFALAYALLRPEGAVLFAIWAALLVAEFSVRRVARWAAWFVVPFGVLEVLRVAYFGAVVPNSVRAKSGWTLREMLTISAGHTRTFYAQYGILLAAAMLTVMFGLRRYRIVGASIVFTVAFGALVQLRDGYAGLRYYYPVVPIVFACAAAGGASIVHVCGARSRRRMTTAAAVLAVAALLATSLLWHQQSNLPLPHRFDAVRAVGRLGDLAEEHFPQMAADDYRPELARWLETHASRRDVVALDEVGIVSFHGNVGVLDMWGLGDAHIAALPGKPGRKGDPDYVFARKPTFIVFLSGRCLCVVLAGDRIYAPDARMFAYDLTLSLRRKAHASALLYQRRARITDAVSLDRAIPEPLRIDHALIAGTVTARMPRAALASAGDLLRLQNVVAFAPRTRPGTGQSALSVSVPARATFEANIGATGAHPGGSWTLVVDDGNRTVPVASVHEDAGTGAAFSSRIAADLRGWAGHHVTIRVGFVPDCGSSCTASSAVMLEPRLLIAPR